MVYFLFVLIISLLLLLPVNFCIYFEQYWHKNKKKLSTVIRFRVDIFLFMKINIYKKENKEKNKYVSPLKREWEKWKNQVSIYLKKFDVYSPKKIINDLNLKCTELLWKSEIGIGDAAITAEITGGLWIFKSILISYMTELTPFKNKPSINIKPDFNKQKYRVIFRGIFRSYTGYIILIVTKILFKKIKGGTYTWMETILKN